MDFEPRSLLGLIFLALVRGGDANDYEVNLLVSYSGLLVDVLFRMLSPKPWFVARKGESTADIRDISFYIISKLFVTTCVLFLLLMG